MTSGPPEPSGQSNGAAQIRFHPARPRGRALSVFMIAVAVFFAWMAYLFHCEDFACDAPPPGSKSLSVLVVLILLSLILAVLVRNWQGISADLVVAADHLRLDARGAGIVETDRAIPFADISGFRFQPGYHSRGVLIADRVAARRSGASYVAIPLDGLDARSKDVFAAIGAALAAAGYRIEGGAFAPGLSPLGRTWTLRAPGA